MLIGKVTAVPTRDTSIVWTAPENDTKITITVRPTAGVASIKEGAREACCDMEANLPIMPYLIASYPWPYDYRKS